MSAMFGVNYTLNNGAIVQPPLGQLTDLLESIFGGGTGTTTKGAVLDALGVYPVGCLFFSTSSTNPATTLGFGTWGAYAQGEVPVGFKSGDPDFGTGGATGGEKTHTLTVAETPAHTHNTYGNQLTNTTATGGTNRITNLTGTGGSNTGSTNSVGGDGAHNNLQPYIVVYIWQRTA